MDFKKIIFSIVGISFCLSAFSTSTPNSCLINLAADLRSFDRDFSSCHLNNHLLNELILFLKQHQLSTCQLNLAYNNISDYGAKLLAASITGENCQLNLTGNPIGDAGIAAILDNPSITQLNLSQTNISNNSIKHLLSANHLNNLNLHFTAFTTAEINYVQHNVSYHIQY